MTDQLIHSQTLIYLCYIIRYLQPNDYMHCRSVKPDKLISLRFCFYGRSNKKANDTHWTMHQGLNIIVNGQENISEKIEKSQKSVQFLFTTLLKQINTNMLQI